MKRIIVFGLIVLLFIILGFTILDEDDRIPEDKKQIELKVGDPNVPAPDSAE